MESKYILCTTFFNIDPNIIRNKYQVATIPQCKFFGTYKNLHAYDLLSVECTKKDYENVYENLYFNWSFFEVRTPALIDGIYSRAHCN